MNPRERGGALAGAGGGASAQGKRRNRLVRKIQTLALLRCPPQLVKRAVGAPRLGDESFFSRKRQHITMRAEFTDVWCGAPAAGFEFLDRWRSDTRIGRQRLRVCRSSWRFRRGVSVRQRRSRRKRICVVHHPCNSRPNDFWSA